MAALWFCLLVCAICLEYGHTRSLELRVNLTEIAINVEKFRIQRVIKDLRETKDDIYNTINATVMSLDEIISDLNVTRHINNELKDRMHKLELDLMESKAINANLSEELHKVRTETKMTIDKQTNQIQVNKEDNLRLRASITEIQQKIQEFHHSTTNVTTVTTTLTTTPPEPSTTTTTTTPQTTTEPPTTTVTTTPQTTTTEPPTTTVPELLSTCPDGWEKFQHTCYQFVECPSAKWDQANSRCADQGGILAEPDTREKIQFLNQISGGWDPWLGATDRQVEGTWVWTSSGRPVNSSLWYPGQPDSRWGDGDCMFKGGGGLYDGDCMWSRSYVCERSPSG